ncbi:unnamed protein product [marine sediment metagenome]|uniref:Uncharacterized protein n=1 Tax=marine sediment metagenome TaxID=412755 RepID=X1CKK9_9ZZZZ
MIKKITSSELLEFAIKIYTDSQDPNNRIDKMDTGNIADTVWPLADGFTDSVLRQWIENMKFKKSGYILKDIELILKLGFGNHFGPFNTMDGRAVLDLWLFEYGVKKDGGSKWDPESGQTQRNKFMAQAHRFIKNQMYDKSARKYSQGVTLKELALRHGPDGFKREFPNLYRSQKQYIDNIFQ